MQRRSLQSDSLSQYPGSLYPDSLEGKQGCKTSIFHKEGILAQQIDGIYKLFNIVTEVRERVGLKVAFRKIKRKAKVVSKLPPSNSTIQLNR